MWKSAKRRPTNQQGATTLPPGSRRGRLLAGVCSVFLHVIHAVNRTQRPSHLRDDGERSASLFPEKDIACTRVWPLRDDLGGVERCAPDLKRFGKDVPIKPNSGDITEFEGEKGIGVSVLESGEHITPDASNHAVADILQTPQTSLAVAELHPLGVKSGTKEVHRTPCQGFCVSSGEKQFPPSLNAGLLCNGFPAFHGDLGAGCSEQSVPNEKCCEESFPIHTSLEDIPELEPSNGLKPRRRRPMIFDPLASPPGWRRAEFLWEEVSDDDGEMHDDSQPIGQCELKGQPLQTETPRGMSVVEVAHERQEQEKETILCRSLTMKDESDAREHDTQQSPFSRQVSSTSYMSEEFSEEIHIWPSDDSSGTSPTPERISSLKSTDDNGRGGMWYDETDFVSRFRCWWWCC